MPNVYKSTGEYNPEKERKFLTGFDDMIADLISNKKLHPVVTEVFIKINISLVLITQQYFLVPKNIHPCCTKRCKTKLYSIIHHKDSK